MLVEMYGDKFSEAGFDVIVSSDAEDGLETTKKEKPDLVVLDILLPRGDGISYLKKIREMRDFENMPVVAFSNFDDLPTKKAAFALGAKDYLIKTNYTPQEVVERVKVFIG